MSENKNRVLLMLVDGLRPDAFNKGNLPVFQDLAARGASTFNAKTVFPAVTLPCHMSLFYSVPTTRHGVYDNDYRPMQRPFPGLFELLHQAGKRVGSVYSWEPLRDLSAPSSLDFQYFYQHGGPATLDVEYRIADQAAKFWIEETPDFMFVYFAAVDIDGHEFGWMSPQYLKAAEGCDHAAGQLLDQLRVAGALEDVTVMVTADHGGHERAHSVNDYLERLTPQEDVTIPWIIQGPGIHPGLKIKSPVNIMDTAPTIAHLFGLQTPREWQGKPVEEVYLP